MAVRRVDVLEGDDVVAGEQPRLGLEDRQLGPGRPDLRRPRAPRPGRRRGRRAGRRRVHRAALLLGLLDRCLNPFHPCSLSAAGAVLGRIPILEPAGRVQRAAGPRAGP